MLNSVPGALVKHNKIEIMSQIPCIQYLKNIKSCLLNINFIFYFIFFSMLNKCLDPKKFSQQKLIYLIKISHYAFMITNNNQYSIRIIFIKFVFIYHFLLIFKEIKSIFK
jgi:hypothetical protein